MNIMVKEKDYIVSHVITGVAITTNQYYLINVPVLTISSFIHMTFYASVSPGCTSTIFEGPTISANGTSLTIYNVVRSSTITSEILIYRDPTVTDEGTSIYSEQIGSTTVGGKMYKLGTLNFILKSNTKYLFKLRTLAADTSISVNFQWKEYC